MSEPDTFEMGLNGNSREVVFASVPADGKFLGFIEYSNGEMHGTINGISGTSYGTVNHNWPLCIGGGPTSDGPNTWDPDRFIEAHFDYVRVTAL